MTGCNKYEYAIDETNQQVINEVEHYILPHIILRL